MAEAAEIVSNCFKSGLDYPILDYLTTLWGSEDADAEDDPTELFVRPMLESEQIPRDEIDRICSALQAMWVKQTGGVAAHAPTKLDRIVDMRRQEAMSKRQAQAATQVVDVSSVVSTNDVTGDLAIAY